MLHIRLRSFQQTEADLKEAFYRALKSLRQNDKKEFYSHFWQCLYAAQPLFSDQLSYALNPLNHQYDGFKEKLFSTAEELNTWAVGFASHINQKEIEDLLQGNIHRIFINLALSHLQFDDKLTDDGGVQWLLGSFQSANGLLKRIPFESLPLDFVLAHLHPQKIVDEDFLQAATYWEFHTGGLKESAQAILRTNLGLPPFWSAFLRWHAGKRDNETTRTLTEVVNNRMEKSGKRKTALLLLCWDSPIKAQRLRQVLKNNKALLSPNVKFCGSPDYAVDLSWSSGPTESLAQNIKKLLQIVETGKPADRKNISGQIFGAGAEVMNLKERLQQLKDSNRALITGGLFDERRLQSWICAAFLTKPAKPDWYELDAALADRNPEGLWKAVAVEGKGQGKVKNRPLVALELQQWSESANQALAKLAEHDGTGSPKWPQAIIGTRKKYCSPDDTCAVSSAIYGCNRCVHVDIPPLSERFGDFKEYFDVITGRSAERQLDVDVIVKRVLPPGDGKNSKIKTPCSNKTWQEHAVTKLGEMFYEDDLTILKEKISRIEGTAIERVTPKDVQKYYNCASINRKQVLTEMEMEILEELKAAADLGKGLTKEDLAGKIGLSNSATARHLKRLGDDGKVLNKRGVGYYCPDYLPKMQSKAGLKRD